MKEKTFFSETIKIDAPRDFVFKFLSDFSENVKWIEGLRDAEVTPAKGEIVGTHLKESIISHGHKWEYEEDVIECTEGEYLKINLGDKKEKIILDYTLIDGDYDDTLLTETATILEGSIIHRWFSGFDRFTLQKRLAKFKEVVEEKHKKKEKGI